MPATAMATICSPQWGRYAAEIALPDEAHTILIGMALAAATALPGLVTSSWSLLRGRSGHRVFRCESPLWAKQTALNQTAIALSQSTDPSVFECGLAHGLRLAKAKTAQCSTIRFFGYSYYPAVLLGSYAQWQIKASVAKYSQLRTTDEMTGAEVARRLLESRGLHDVSVEATPGMLTDHYDPRSKVLRLSQDVYFAPSVAAAGIAAHETGHALQDADDYFPMRHAVTSCRWSQLASRMAPGCLSPD